MSEIDWKMVQDAIDGAVAGILADAGAGKYDVQTPIVPTPEDHVGMPDANLTPNPYGSTSGIPATDNPYAPPAAMIPVNEIPATALAPSVAEIELPELKGKTIVASALRQQGKKYGWGGTGPNVFDCSGLTQWAYADALGISLPRTTYEQVKVGREVKFSEAIDGDLIFSNFSDKGPEHVSINMAGPDNVIEAGNPVGIYKWGNRGKVIVKRYV